MSRLLQKVFKSRNKLPAVASTVDGQPGDGIGYPVSYDGKRLIVDNKLLSKCQVLAPYSGAFRLNDNTVIKTGDAVSMGEAAAMRLVSEKTSIPTPKVFDALHSG